jgi:hypothetical protein
MKADGRRQPGEVLNKPTTSGSTLNRSRRLHAYENTTLRMIVATIAGTALASLFAPTADAALIVDQQPTADIGLPSTLFTLTPTASVEEIDSFTTVAAYRLGHAHRFHVERRSGAGHLGQRFDLLWGTDRRSRRPVSDHRVRNTRCKS